MVTLILVFVLVFVLVLKLVFAGCALALFAAAAIDGLGTHK